jgi:hypothetical protein
MICVYFIPYVFSLIHGEVFAIPLFLSSARNQSILLYAGITWRSVQLFWFWGSVREEPDKTGKCIEIDSKIY